MRTLKLLATFFSHSHIVAHWLASHTYDLNYDCNGLPHGSAGKEFACNTGDTKRHDLNPWVRKIPWRRKWQPTLVFLLEKFHGQEPGELHSVGSQRVGCNWTTEYNYCNMMHQSFGKCWLTRSHRYFKHWHISLCNPRKTSFIHITTNVTILKNLGELENWNAYNGKDKFSIILIFTWKVDFCYWQK